MIPFTEVITTAPDLFLSDILNLVEDTVSLYFDIVNEPANILIDVNDALIKMFGGALIKIGQTFATFRAIGDKEKYVINKMDLLEDWQVMNDYANAMTDLIQGEAEYNTEKLIASYKTNRQQAYRQSIATYGAGAYSQTIATYGTNITYIAEGQSFENLAKKYYGDVSKANVIASANAASSIEELKQKGSTIVLIPILQKQEYNERNKILGYSFQRDNYGIDIALDEDGNLLLNDEGTDFKFVRGRENISQSILMRLRENVNKRVRLQLYGIKTTLPDDAVAGVAYIHSSIVQTLKQEPRIKKIKSLSFKGEGDVLRIDLEYEDIGGNLSSFSGYV